MKKILIPALLILLLTGCFESTTTTTTTVTEGFRAYATNEFSIQVPTDWEDVTPINFKNGTPKNTLMAFRNNVRNARFTANVVIIKNDLSAEADGLTYAKALYQKVKSELIGFREILAEQTKVIVAEKEAQTIFTHVEGKDAAESDTKRLIQLSGVKGKTAYIAIGAFLPEESDIIGKKIETMIRSFEVK